MDFNLNKYTGFLNGKSVLVLGSNGMLGTELFESLKSAALRHDIEYVYGMDGSEVQQRGILERHGLGDFMRMCRKFDICVNCVAMTDTFSAENTNDGRDLSYRLNARLPGILAESCAYWNVKLVHVSTDYVFGREIGEGNCKPYRVGDICFPKNIYGTHKLLGEEFARRMFVEAGKEKLFACLRVSWLYGMANNKSFVHKFIRNAVKAVNEGKDSIDVTSNEYSVPTSTGFVCDLIFENFIKRWRTGIFHAIPPGKAISRSDWARSILERLSTVNTVSTDTVLGKLKPEFVNPVQRKGMLNPEWSVLEWSDLRHGHQYTSCGHTECLRNFMAANANNIYNWALSQAC